ncbi:hypothetical protein Mucpa_1874 [Mucilaginibacter paludis DSM 18603]|uniref:Uncharacterized protein n=1 Tax=Mucilaginibacter paludis DSM 18603 TaxID=714943 RepID=H1YBR0_9SPHI|nr:hypothetical protein Mucpa_1874 [Mucilaginibacter paludis DSM 18603]
MEMAGPKDQKVVSDEQAIPGIFEPGKEAADQENDL